MMTTTVASRAATRRQLWALFCLTKRDHRNDGLSLEEASRLIEEAKEAKGQRIEGFAVLYARADEAGRAAGGAATPTPMVVQQHANQFNDASKVVKSWYVEGGVCGFAWVKIRPGTCAFARWLVKTEKGKADSYAGGVMIWADGFGQSMARKEAYARAFAEVLQQAGINAYPQSRID